MYYIHKISVNSTSAKFQEFQDAGKGLFLAEEFHLPLTNVRNQLWYVPGRSYRQDQVVLETSTVQHQIHSFLALLDLVREILL